MREQIYKEYTEQKDTYDLFAKKLTSLIEELLNQEKIDYQSINYRTKDNLSFSNKLEKKADKYERLDDITDIAGIRVITYYSDSVDEVAKIIGEQFIVDEDNTIDKRKALDPDRFGYLSLHYVISLKEDRFNLPEYRAFKGLKAEIQIRSISQHTWAEIEHDLGYKSEIEVPKEIRRDFYRLAGLLELVDKEFIEIREKLKEYTNNIEHQINKQAEVVLIDSISLKIYIESSENLRELNESICSITESAYNKKDTITEDVLKRLRFVGLNSIQDIDYEINLNKEGIHYIAERVFNLYEKTEEKPLVFYSTIGLFYLCYYKLAEKQSLELIIKYFSETNIHHDSEETEEDFANVLISAYNDYKNGN